MPDTKFKPASSSLHRSLLKQHRQLQQQLSAMEGKLEKQQDKPGASLLSRGLRAYNNTMVDIGEKLNKANPSYRAIQRRLNKVENQLDTESQRLSRQGGSK